MTQDFVTPGKILKPYPAAEDVFVPDQVGLIRHLHPLVSVDLSAANPDWSGWAHILSPIEPYNHNIGELTKEYHSDFLRENFIGFKLEGDRYRLLGDPRYFLMENPIETVFNQLHIKAQPRMHAVYKELAKHYVEEEASYRAASASYLKHGALYFLNDNGERHDGNPDPQPLIEQLGGAAGFGNWMEGADFPIIHAPYQGGGPEEVWPLSPAGNRFEFVASTAGYPYRKHGADSILLFYEPKERIALLTFDWT